MSRPASTLLAVVLIIILVGIVGCGGEPASTLQPQTSVQNATTSASQTSSTSTGSGELRNENWLIGTWTATIPKTDTSFFAGKKIKLNVASVILVSNEKVQGNPTGKYAYTGNIILDDGGEEHAVGFAKEDLRTGEGVLMWGYASPGANQFIENISLRAYDLTLSIELDWGPQISKPGSTFNLLQFHGSIQDLETSEQDFFNADFINFTQTSSTAPAIASPKPAPTSGGTSTTTPTSSPATTTSTGSGTGDIWSDIPIYTNAQQAEDQGFGLSVGGDASYSQIEWRFYATTDDIAKVVDFYKKQMPANGWTKSSWLDMGEMSYGSYQKNNETRVCLVYVIKGEDGTAINIMSGGKQ